MIKFKLGRVMITKDELVIDYDLKLAYMYLDLYGNRWIQKSLNDYDLCTLKNNNAIVIENKFIMTTDFGQIEHVKTYKKDKHSKTHPIKLEFMGRNSFVKLYQETKTKIRNGEKPYGI